MVYDAARDVVVLFGGRGTSGPLGDTWEWDGSDWRERPSSPSPPARASVALAHDVARGRVVLFGGTGSQNDVWEWDGTTWQRLQPTIAPAGRAAMAMAYDASRQRVVLFGGKVAVYPRSDTWEWDGQSWTLADEGGGNEGREDPALVYDSVRQRVIAVGGSASAGARSDVRSWTGSGWIEIDAGSPPEAIRRPMAYDESRQRAVLLDQAGKTWEWDGVRWHHARSTVTPPYREDAAMAYDGAQQRVLLYGGDQPDEGGRFPLFDTWVWDGSVWTQLRPQAPTTSYSHAMAYDSARKRIVMFGGIEPVGRLSDATWEWNGTDWMLRAPPISPSARLSAAMAYDPVRQRTVLFGGSGQGRLSDTWEWDGTSWAQHFPSTVPAPRSQAAMAFDAARGRIVMYGGNAGGTVSMESWEWDGSDWLQVVGSGPGARFAPQMAADALGRVVLFSGAYSLADTWVYTTLPAASVVSEGAGCPGSAGVPLLGGFGNPALGAAGFELQLDHARGQAPLAFLLGAGAASFALGGGCTLLLDPSTVVVAVNGSANAFGFARLPLPVPLETGLAGASVFSQSAVLDPAGPVLGLAASARLHLVLGD